MSYRFRSTPSLETLERRALLSAGQLDPTTIDRWVVAAAGKNHRWNKTTKNYVSETLLKYKGMQAGEVDWRPTETIPEDYYAM